MGELTSADRRESAIDFRNQTVYINGDQLTTVVPIAKGGTGESVAADAFEALSPLTTKGDLVGHNGTTAVRVPAGVDGKFLKANSAQASGLEWADTPAADFDAIAPTNTKGDIIVHNGTDNVRVAVGANDTYLKANSAQASGVEWVAIGESSVKRCRATRTTNQNQATGVEVAVAWTSEDYDTDTMHDNATNNSRITITTAGVYALRAKLAGLVTTNNAQIRLRVNGTTEIAKIQTSLEPGVIAVEYPLNAADYVEVMVTQNSGSTTVVAGSGSFFSAHRIGGL